MTLSGLEPGSRYQFRVKAVNSLGHSPASIVSDPVTITVHRTAVVAPVFVSGIEDRVALENDQVFYIFLLLIQLKIVIINKVDFNNITNPYNDNINCIIQDKTN